MIQTGGSREANDLVSCPESLRSKDVESDSNSTILSLFQCGWFWLADEVPFFSFSSGKMSLLYVERSADSQLRSSARAHPPRAEHARGPFQAHRALQVGTTSSPPLVTEMVSPVYISHSLRKLL
jgi:hypothetical protein